MTHICIAVVDATRARLFTIDREADADGVHESFEERRDLVDPARRQPPHERFSDPHPGSSRVGDRRFAFDDHREGALDELDATFARDIASQLDQLSRETHASRLIVCAAPHMLGKLRAAHNELSPRVEIDEIPRDLAKLSTSELRDQLESYGALPPRPRN